MDTRQPSIDNPYWNLIGLREVELKDGTSVIELPIKREITQRRGTVHGGVLASLVDSSIGAAIRSVLPPGMSIITAELKLNYIRPGVGTKFIGRGSVIHMGRTLAVGEAKIWNQDGKLIAAGMATFKLLVEDKDFSRERG